MNNQYNPQQPAPQQTTSTQTVQQAAPQQNYQQPNQQVQYQQPYQQAYAPMPPRPRIDPAVAKKQKKDAVEAFGDKLYDLMNTNPILSFIAKYADYISYGVTGICVLFTIIALIASNSNMFMVKMNFGGEVGGCFIFSILAVIFGVLSLCKKKMMPLTVSMSAVSALMLTRVIVAIVTVIKLSSYTISSYISDISDNLLRSSDIFGSANIPGLSDIFNSSNALGSLGSAISVTLPGGIIINLIFLILEMLVVGFLTYICWTYFLATLPPRPVMQQPYQQPYNPQQNMQQNYQQPAAPGQNPVQQAAYGQPAAQQINLAKPAAPQQEAVPTSTICPNCQTVNGVDSSFCQKCGARLK